MNQSPIISIYKGIDYIEFLKPYLPRIDCFKPLASKVLSRIVKNGRFNKNRFYSTCKIDGLRFMVGIIFWGNRIHKIEIKKFSELYT